MDLLAAAIKVHGDALDLMLELMPVEDDPDFQSIGFLSAWAEPPPPRSVG